jgi:Leucine-rich repeat (LRR) protein
MADVSLSDKAILLKLYEATNGNNWTKKWDLSSPVSTWHGIKLDGDKVVAINLMDNNLVGQIPSEIVNLPNLQELNLHKNTLSGEIPLALENLKELKVLDLSFNRLTGSIPTSICLLHNLEDVQLYMNNLSESCLNK